MYSEETESIDFKPSRWLYIFLFIYYSIWLMQSYGTMRHYIDFGFDDLDKFGPLEWCSGILFIIAGVYSFYAVIKTLRGDTDCITALKWSLILVLLYSLTNPTRGQIATYSILWMSIAFFSRPAFYLVFYLYLCFAKGIKRRYPKSERRFGPSGWMWSCLLAANIGIGAYGAYLERKTSAYCKPVDIALLELKPGEISDGYVIFNSDRQWTEWKNPADTLYIAHFDEILDTYPTLISTDSVSSAYISSGRCDKINQRTYNQILVQVLNSDYVKADEKWITAKEIAFTDSIITDKRLISTILQTEIDSVPMYLEVAMISELSSPKCCIITHISKRPILHDESIQIASSMRFDLKKIAESQYNKGGGNNKDKHTNRTTKRKYNTDANMLCSLLNCFAPCHLSSVMTLKHNKREIAYCECNYVFYDVLYCHINAKL